MSFMAAQRWFFFLPGGIQIFFKEDWQVKYNPAGRCGVPFGAAS